MRKKKISRKEIILNLLRERPHTALMLAVRLNVVQGGIYPYLKELYKENLITGDYRRWCLVTGNIAMFHKASAKAGGCRNEYKFDFNRVEPQRIYICNEMKLDKILEKLKDKPHTLKMLEYSIKASSKYIERCLGTLLERKLAIKHYKRACAITGKEAVYYIASVRAGGCRFNINKKGGVL